jgi:hypothetical protein
VGDSSRDKLFRRYMFVELQTAGLAFLASQVFCPILDPPIEFPRNIKFALISQYVVFTTSLPSQHSRNDDSASDHMVLWKQVLSIKPKEDMVSFVLQPARLEMMANSSTVCGG